MPLTDFSISEKEKKYPQFSDKAVVVFLPFSVTYRCEQKISTLVLIKNGRRSYLKGFEQELRGTLSTIEPGPLFRSGTHKRPWPQKI